MAIDNIQWYTLGSFVLVMHRMSAHVFHVLIIELWGLFNPSASISCRSLLLNNSLSSFGDMGLPNNGRHYGQIQAWWLLYRINLCILSCTQMGTCWSLLLKVPKVIPWSDFHQLFQRSHIYWCLKEGYRNNPWD